MNIIDNLPSNYSLEDVVRVYENGDNAIPVSLLADLLALVEVRHNNEVERLQDRIHELEEEVYAE